MALKFKNEAEFQQWAQQHGKTIVGGTPAIPATSNGNSSFSISISPRMWKILGWILWWYIGFVFGALTRQ